MTEAEREAVTREIEVGAMDASPSAQIESMNQQSQVEASMIFKNLSRSPIVRGTVLGCIASILSLSLSLVMMELINEYPAMASLGFVIAETFEVGPEQGTVRLQASAPKDLSKTNL